MSDLQAKIMAFLTNHGTDAATETIHAAMTGMAYHLAPTIRPTEDAMIALKAAGSVREFSSWGVSYWTATPTR